LVVDWFGNLLWLQPKKQQTEFAGIAFIVHQL
jgi:hypothetical protein